MNEPTFLPLHMCWSCMKQAADDLARGLCLSCARELDAVQKGSRR